MPDDLTVVSSQPLPDLSVVSSQPLPDAGPQGSALWRGAKTAAGDLASIIHASGEALFGGPTGAVAAAPAQAAQAYLADQARKAAGYSPAYRVAAQLGSVAGVNAEGMEEAAAKGDTAGVIGHTVVPLAGAALGADQAISGGKGASAVAKTVSAGYDAAKEAAGFVLRNPETNQPRLPIKIVSQVAKTVGGPEIVNELTPDNPTFKAAQDKIEAQAADEAKAADIDKARKMQDIFLRRQAREQAAATKAQIQTQKSSIITPKTVVPESEGRPATWTNEKVLSMAGTGDVRAIQQARLRALDLPPNAALVSNRAATITPSVGTPRSTTLFDASGHPIGGEPEIELMNTEGSRTNASGESGASMEAINRSHSERLAGTKRIRIDTRSGNEIPLLGADAVDAKPGPYDEIITRDKNGNETTLDRGEKARPRRTVQ